MGRVHPILLLFRIAWLSGVWCPRPEMAQKLEGASYIIIIIIKDCLAKWGVVPRPEMANMMFGGRKLEGASNIVFR